MGLYGKDSPARDAQELQRERERIAEERRQRMLSTPGGRAREARRRGWKTFQIELPISQTTAHGALFLPVQTSTTSHAEGAGTIIDEIERQGWRLAHVGYVYRVTGGVTKERVLGSAEREAVAGEIVGIYLFRVDAEASTPPAAEPATARDEQDPVTPNWRSSTID